jgi:hypothetical protein
MLSEAALRAFFLGLFWVEAAKAGDKSRASAASDAPPNATIPPDLFTPDSRLDRRCSHPKRTRPVIRPTPGPNTLSMLHLFHNGLRKAEFLRLMRRKARRTRQAQRRLPPASACL